MKPRLITASATVVALVLLACAAAPASAARYCPNSGVYNGVMYCNVTAITRGKAKPGPDGWVRPIEKKKKKPRDRD